MMKNLNHKMIVCFLGVLMIWVIFNCELVEKITKSDGDKCGGSKTVEKKYESPETGFPLHWPFTTYLEGNTRHFYFSQTADQICPHKHIDITFEFIARQKNIENLTVEASVMYFVLYDRPIAMNKVGNLTWRATDNFGIKHAFGDYEGDIFAMLDFSFPTRGDETLDRNHFLFDIIHQCSITIKYKKYKK